KFAIYSGTSGIIYFFIQMAKATGDDSYLEDAIEGGRYIINNWSNGSELLPYGDIVNSQWCFINGASGIAYVSTELANATGQT
ncbi:lanthionine synthetase LanC family protein, partial [Streptococcus pyogenes]